MVTSKESELEKVKNEVFSLNASLKKLGSKKESEYKEKNALEGKLNKLISSANELKVKKSNVDKKITDLKKKREEKNNEVQTLIKNLHGAKKSQKSSNKYLLKKNELKKRVRDLEFKVQTEVLNFNKEKSYMSMIKLAKKELLELDAKLKTFDKVKKIQTSIRKTKEVADNFHKQIQDASKESSDIFSKLTLISKEIAEIKKKRSNMRSTLKSLKGQINQVNHTLGKQLGHLGTLPRATGKVFMDGARASAGILHKKTEAVKEKFKKKKKLSREDILLLQREAINDKKNSRKGN